MGKTQKIKVVYDWLPLSCTKCKGIEHVADQCRREVMKVRKPIAPVITPEVGQGKVLNEESLPRRFITRLLRHDTGEPRLLTPRGITFMDALNLSMHKARAESKKKLGFLTKNSENGGVSGRKLGTICVVTGNNSLHQGGRVWLLWDPKLYQVDVLDITAQCIHSRIFDKMKKVYFWVTMVYGFNKLQERESLWEKLRSYALQCDGSWAVCGDFNNIVAVDERIGGTEVTWAEMAPMRNMMSDCNLFELKMKGSYYTWNNKHEAATRVYSRLDRVIVNDDWLISFPESVAHFLPEGLFDHCPCIISMADTYVRKKPSFKYYNMWSLAPNYLIVVQSGWHVEVQGTPMFRIVKKLKGLKQKLKELDREQFSDIENLTHVPELSLKYFQEQSAFIAGRGLVGNILICQDLIKLYKRKKCSPRLMMKIDLQKAYDSIEWSYLNEMLRGNLESVTLMLRAFSTFSLASGLQMNKDKSNFYCNGVTDSVVQAIENASGMRKAAIPFKYLGVKIMHKRLGVLDRLSVDRVTERIQRLGARKLSYAGRVVLISSVLSTLHSYWATVFIIPQTVMKKIESICRAFLWYGNDSCERPNLVSWKQICQPEEGKGSWLQKFAHTGT
ncbi:uncharacterized protein LOC141627961 [Silene latifolia]|uniref:uncharacterized protein LOC141627961 n=1 Tax=Silene latifolia TaxID=37657 RepID=UPI003D76CBD4